MGTIHKLVLAGGTSVKTWVRERPKHFCFSSGFRIAIPPPEIPKVGDAPLEIPVDLIRKFPGPEKNY